jgi:hypothetical protein
MELNFTPKNAKEFYCDKCDFKCSKNSDWMRHISTRKHNKELFGIKKTPTKKYLCTVCKKQYFTQSGLWKHQSQNKCIIDKKSEVEENEVKYKDIILSMVQKNNDLQTSMFSEFKNMMTEVIPKLQSTNINTTNNICINMFLNEHCKDAMNMTEFIESIQLNIDDMTKIGTEGQTKGMANVLVDKLNALDIFKRPVHCSDIKKETIYIKDENEWKKEENNKPKLKNALDELTKKTFHSLPCLEENPDTYVKTVSEIIKDPREDKKIISEIAKNITIKNI